MHDYLTAAHIANRQAAHAAGARDRAQARLALAARRSQPRPWRIARIRRPHILANRTVDATA